MADTIRLSASGCIHNRSCHSDTSLMHDQPVGMVDVSPQAGITTGIRRWSRRWSWWWQRSRRKAHINRRNPADLVMLCLNMIEAAVGGHLHQHQPVAFREVCNDRSRFRRITPKVHSTFCDCLLRPGKARAQSQQQDPQHGSPECDSHSLLLLEFSKKFSGDLRLSLLEHPYLYQYPFCSAANLAFVSHS